MRSNIIRETATIKEALIALDDNTHDCQTLFVVDNDERMVGTLTDGDVRRGLIGGAQLDNRVRKVMHRDFKYLRDKESNPAYLKYLRNLRIFLIPILDDNNHIVRVCNLLKYNNILPVDAVLMAGGKGERLRPLTEKTPKPLLPVGGKAIIDYNIERLLLYGIKNIYVTANYLAEQLEKHFEEPFDDVNVKIVREPKFLGTIGSIRYVKEFFNDTILVMNSDLLTNLDYEDFYLHFKENDADMSVVAVPYSVSIPYGILNLDSNSHVQGILEKPTYEYYANAGIYLIKKSILSFVPVDKMFHSTNLLGKLIDAGKKVTFFPLNGMWIDIGNPQEYKRANDLVKYMH